MCFGFQRSSARGDIENGTNNDGVPARKVASLRSLDGGGEKLDISEPATAKPEKKKKWNDDEYGDSVR
ncbi:hypothetical protein V498_05543 [Pseudogymnoascus sp. VKM F-4517 (FW-2822)]|nr:hypothetical protein V498_05543 [Pseudogymnoascus sp. VKM F-4517 (FW-2822)]